MTRNHLNNWRACQCLAPPYHTIELHGRAARWQWPSSMKTMHCALGLLSCAIRCEAHAFATMDVLKLGRLGQCFGDSNEKASPGVEFIMNRPRPKQTNQGDQQTHQKQFTSGNNTTTTSSVFAENPPKRRTPAYSLKFLLVHKINGEEVMGEGRRRQQQQQQDQQPSKTTNYRLHTTFYLKFPNNHTHGRSPQASSTDRRVRPSPTSQIIENTKTCRRVCMPCVPKDVVPP